ncbi:hypothetical protein BU26DRAFT_423657 [Trematosphaeria pertusa]|uniref:AhpC-TSA-domain-containing protein n=1 Tax=Trematosphaeria pertusa TaxID=390896 RepID=A0A6A6ILZ6_9PLEO|nr:uncharacterized protein BU26DRAFT_423657 [Trematosphaeria pertusa]KAF2251088.1 hypothetical protein BU26DRAFT_423657 [Trematosphaeria pertusa]
MDTSNPQSADPTVPSTTAPASQLSAKPPTPPPSQSGPDPKISTSADTPDATTPPFSPSSTTPVLEKQDLDFTGNVEVNNDLPTEKDLKRVDDLLVLDAQGQSRPFRDLYKGEGVAPRQMIIFVRHFFCGNCQEYLRELSASITPESLLALPEPTFITVIGCGRPDLIEMYSQTTSCPFPVYADPTRKLYDYLGMTRTLDLGKKPSYIQSNLFVTSVQSILQGLKTGGNALKGGDIKQVGGEFLFEDGKCVWAHRMRNTRDHAEITEVREVLGLEDKKPPMRKRWSHGIKMMKEKEGKGRSASWGRGRSKSKGAKDKEGSKTPEMVEEEAKPNRQTTV